MTEIVRCAWRGMAGDPLYEAYHDTEWGVPERDPQALWAKLVLDGFQAGLVVDHDPEEARGVPRRLRGLRSRVVARFGEADRARLMADPGIIRSNAKIDAAIGGARLYLDMREAGEDFSEFLWGFVGGAPIQNAWTGDGDVPAQTAESVDMSKALKAKGFKFCGPVIVYAFMQAVGMVNDHTVECHRYAPIRAMGQTTGEARERRPAHAPGAGLPGAGVRGGRGGTRALGRAGLRRRGDPAPPRAQGDR